MARDANKLQRQTLGDKIKELVEFYEKFKPDGGKRIEVNCSPKQLAKALGVDLPKDKQGRVEQKREWDYRGRVLIAIGPED